MKINSKIVIKKDEPVKLDRPELERSNTTAPTSESRGDSKSDSRRDKPDVDPLSRRLVNDSFNLKNPHHHKQQSLPPTLADLNNHMSESQMDANQLINDAQSIQQALDKSMNEKAEKPSFIVAEKVIFSNNEKKKQFTIIPTDESDKKVNRFAYIKAYANLDESLQTSPSTSASSNPTPTKASSIDPSPTKTIDPSPLKITGKLNLEHVPIGRDSYFD